MRYLYVKLTGYIGIYNGLGLSEIELNLDRCRNQITVISGPNGVGKSTIINAIHLLPDNNSCFVPTMAAKKELVLQDKENIYSITILHPLDKHNGRATTKVSIMKNGMELNPNGNVSSYKDIIFNEFDMDSNYLSLSKISGDNRGLADKKPAERKKIMSSLISSLEVYNNIYKNLNKKANIFKSYISNSSSKIKNVGDEQSLRLNLESLNNREFNITCEMDVKKATMIEYKTIVSLADPDGKIKEEYDALISEVEVLKERYERFRRFLIDNSHKVRKELCFEGLEFDKLAPKIANSIKGLEVTLETLQCRLDNLNVDSKEKLHDMNLNIEEQNRIKIKIDKLNSETGSEDIENIIREYKSSIASIEDMFYKLGVVNMDDISKDEIEHTIGVILTIIDMIDILYSEMSTEQHEKILDYYGVDFEERLLYYDNEISTTSSQIAVMKSNKSVISVLTDRPNECKVDTCPFISNALRIKSQYRDIDKDIKFNEEKEIKLVHEKENLRKYKDIVSKIREIRNIIDSNIKFLQKFSITSSIIDINTFLECIRMRNMFDSLKCIRQYTELSNYVTEYKSKKDTLQKLETEYIVYSANKKMIDGFELELKRLEVKYAELQEKYDKIKFDIDGTTKLYNAQKNYKEQFENIYRETVQYLEAEVEYNTANNRCNELAKTFDNSLKYIEQIKDLEIIIRSYEEELKHIQMEKRNIDSQLTLIENYKMEYETYSTKYNFVDTLRKYSSPTSGSIQSLFMSIYMDKTLSMVNELLGMMFGGQYKILQYVINEEEFRIPFIGNGLVVDDISSGSTSQVCIMGMIINLVLANISSGKYNIVSLDEIDGGLDHVNRYKFVEVLQKICMILEMEQIFIISHSVESALNNVDVILLSNSQEYVDQFANANIVYQFKG